MSNRQNRKSGKNRRQQTVKGRDRKPSNKARASRVNEKRGK